MVKIFLISTFLFTSLAHSKMKTEHIWIKNPEKFYVGICYEIDSKTKGQKYRSRVKDINCQPKSISYYFLPQEEECFAVDTETTGKIYAAKTDIKSCRPKDTIKIYAKFRGKHGCYEVDKETSGEKYFDMIPIRECDSKNKTSYFKLEQNHEGKCYINEGDHIINVHHSICRPESPSYKFYRENPTRGSCYEQDPKGEEYYSKKTDIINCKPEKTVFIFYTDPKNPKNAKCYELDEMTKCEQYLNIVKDKNCKN